MSGTSRSSSFSSTASRRSTAPGILAPSETYRQVLLDNGFTPSKLDVFGRGVDVNHFNPRRRIPGYWQRHGLKDQFTFLYVGRVSAEKNIEVLLASFAQLLARGVSAQLAIVGDGPLLADLRSRFAHPSIAFTGFMEGDALATAYASADAFVFPSTTDTFGNVVLEAMASGLPVIVSNQGGPKETVGRSGAGFVINTGMPGALVESMTQLATDKAVRWRMREAALGVAKASSWEKVFDALWMLGQRPAPSAAAGFVEPPAIEAALV